MQPLVIAGALALGLGVAAASPTALAGPAQPPAAAAAAVPAAPKLQAEMRALWHGHIVATRDYALAVHAGGSAAAQKAGDAAVANAKQIADVMADYYGHPAGDALLKLLDSRWGSVKALTDATRAHDAVDEQAAMNDLASNAAAIAMFLSGANPNWTEAQLRGALMTHVNDHRIQIDEMMVNAPKAEQAKSWEEMQQHMNRFADALTLGIAQQFPARVD